LDRDRLAARAKSSVAALDKENAWIWLLSCGHWAAVTHQVERDWCAPGKVAGCARCPDETATFVKTLGRLAGTGGRLWCEEH
jgi:hypothetical protein